MRALTLSGFLAAYVRDLSGSDTLSISKLYKIMNDGNHRLKEPLFLYCCYSGKSGLLIKHLSRDEKDELSVVSDCISKGSTDKLPVNYQKVYEAYRFRSDRYNNEARIKALMADKIIRLQTQKNISNYRIYTDLHINAGNFNDFIKNRRYNKLSLDKSREVLDYLKELS